MNWIKSHKLLSAIIGMIGIIVFAPTLLGGFVLDTTVALIAAGAIWLLVWLKKIALPVAIGLGIVVALLWWRWNKQ